MLREVATWLGDPDPSPVAEAAVLTTATRWKAPTSTGDNRRAPSAPPTLSLRRGTPSSEPRHGLPWCFGVLLSLGVSKVAALCTLGMLGTSTRS